MSLPAVPTAGRSTHADSTRSSNPEGEAAPDAARASSFGMTASAIRRVLPGANDGDVAAMAMAMTMMVTWVGGRTCNNNTG